MRKMTLLALALAAVALPGAPRADEAVELVDVPADVEALVFRNASCWSTNHTKDISIAQREAGRLYFKCDAIADDEAALRQKYQTDPRVLNALDFAILPADVDDVLHRRTSCIELTKAASEHPDRSHESEAIRLFLKCDSLAKDEAALRRKYSYDARVLKALDGKWVINIRRAPIRIAPYTGPAGLSKERP